MARRRRAQSSSGGGFVVLLGLAAIAWLIAFIVRHIWVILGGLAVIGSLYIARAILRENRRKQQEYDRYCAETAAKADQQDDWVAQGDDRGIFGPGAADLEDYIRSSGRASVPRQDVRPLPPIPKPLSPARQAAAPAVVASGLGVALLLAQVGGPGSDPAPNAPTSTRTTTQVPPRTQLPATDMPSPTPSPTPTPTYSPLPVAPSSSPLPTPEPPPTYVPSTTVYPPPPPFYTPIPQSTYYKNCSQAHQDGRYNIPRGDPAYRPGLDRDQDGFACE